MTYLKFEIEAGNEAQEMLIAQLSQFAPTGFEQQAASLLVYFNPQAFDENSVHGLLKNFSFTAESLPDKNWNELWESSFEPVRVGSFCAVRAHFHQPVTNVQHEIIITPKMSFGTGHHATTFLMMEAMALLDFKNKTVLDFGTGTGILAILAENCGAAHVDALDHDAWAFENVQENISLNNCSQVNAALDDTVPAGPYDVILANITRSVLTDQLPRIGMALAPRGVFLCSGLLVSDCEQMVAAAAGAGMIVAGDSRNGDWLAISFKKA